MVYTIELKVLNFTGTLNKNHDSFVIKTSHLKILTIKL